MSRTGIRTVGNVRRIAQPLWDAPFLKACRGEAVPHAPVWLMRQAGRYMEHYRGLRARLSFLELCKDPDAAAEAALFARDWLGVDAAIVFSDILVVLEALGMPLEFTAGGGPRLPRPLAGVADLDALRDPADAAADLGYVAEAVRRTVAGLPATIPCIGFAGAPFTLAAYAIEGGGSRHFLRAKTFMWREPALWHRLNGILAECIAAHLNQQIAAGATAVQLFDSWAGCLTAEDYAAFAAPHLAAVVQAVAPGVPVIVFGTGTQHLLPQLAATGADVVGIDTTTPFSAGWAACGGPARVAAQGNLDPTLLLGPWTAVREAADRLLAATAPGHIVNLGHGILKETPPEMARDLVRYVHERTAR
jgi:uroporphyrinogen decarboxylase